MRKNQISHAVKISAVLENTGRSLDFASEVDRPQVLIHHTWLHGLGFLGLRILFCKMGLIGLRMELSGRVSTRP
jgi:hypothetical protein